MLKKSLVSSTVPGPGDEEWSRHWPRLLETNAFSHWEVKSLPPQKNRTLLVSTSVSDFSSVSTLLQGYFFSSHDPYVFFPRLHSWLILSLHLPLLAKLKVVFGINKQQSVLGDTSGTREGFRQKGHLSWGLKEELDLIRPKRVGSDRGGSLGWEGTLGIWRNVSD